MDRVAVFVDAGYFFTQGAKVALGRSVLRAELRLRVPEVVSALKSFAEERSGIPLLRIYWYDGDPHGVPRAEQNTLNDHDHVKLRLGMLDFEGKQKGVDSLVVTDMITLARNQAMAHCVLMSSARAWRIRWIAWRSVRAASRSARMRPSPVRMRAAREPLTTRMA